MNFFAPKDAAERYAKGRPDVQSYSIDRALPAEDQPFENETFDLLTVSSGVHWFDIDRFLTEARRILKSGSWLVLYENYIDAAIENGNLTYDEVQTWLHKELTPFFSADEEAPRAVSYGNWIKFIQRMD